MLLVHYNGVTTFKSCEERNVTMIAFGEPAELGPWKITLLNLMSGDDAANQVIAWNKGNPPAPEGLTYVIVRLSLKNIGDRRRLINLADFMATGSDGILRRPPTIEIGESTIQNMVEPGTTLEGVVPLIVDAVDQATLWFESTLLGGNWANGTFALGPNAIVLEQTASLTATEAAGNTPDAPARLGEPVLVDNWEVVLTDMAEGQAVFDIAGPELQALGHAAPKDIPNWLAVYGTITNMSSVPSFFSPNAFEITDDQGEPWDNIVALTPPPPDLSAYLLPGISREGWAAFQRLDYGDSYSTAFMVRLWPSSLVGKPRYIALPNVTAPDEDSGSEDDSLEVAPLEVSVGEEVMTTEDLVNLRTEPSVDGEIIEMLPINTSLIITGDPVEADGYRWYPVQTMEDEQGGFVVQDFISPTNANSE